MTHKTRSIFFLLKFRVCAKNLTAGDIKHSNVAFPYMYDIYHREGWVFIFFFLVLVYKVGP